jgi:uncharacterized protein
MKWLLLAVVSLSASAQTAPDPELLSYISQIRAIDNHAHPMRLLRGGEKNDPEVDALPAAGIGEGPVPVRGRADNLEYVPIWRELYGYPHQDAAPDHLKELEALRARRIAERGAQYPAWILDQIGIERMLSNRVAMAPELPAARFPWIAFADALMYPLDNSELKKETPDRAVFFADEERLLQRYLNGSRRPATLPEYKKRVVTATLERLKSEGAVGVKFEMAYLRTLSVANVSEDEASEVYRRSSLPEYKRLQDHLFRYIVAEAGRLELPVQIHVMGGGLGSYFSSAGANPILLEPLFNDRSLRSTKFVLVHGGEPWDKQTRAMFAKPNVYADISAQTTILYPRSLAAMIRDWLETYPDRVLFGTDAFPVNDKGGWEESGYLAAITARKALALALTGMLEDGEITRDRAHELARMVMRENARSLYGLN